MRFWPSYVPRSLYWLATPDASNGSGNRAAAKTLKFKTLIGGSGALG